VVIVAYARFLPDAVAGTLASVVREGSETEDMRMLFVMNKKKTLQHLLVDSGVEHAVARELELPDASLYVVCTVVRPPRGADVRDNGRDGSWALGISAQRELEGVFSVELRGGRASFTEIAFPATSYRHARVPLL